MKVLFWLFIGLDRHETSEHLLTAMIEQLCKNGHSVHIVQKDTGGDLPKIPDRLAGYNITTSTIPFKKANKGNFVARYIKEVSYIRKCTRFFKEKYDAVFIQSNNVAGFALKAVRTKLPNAIVTFNVQDIFPQNIRISGKLKSNSIVFKVLAAIQRYGYKKSNHIITISEDMKNTLIDAGASSNKIEVIYNWSYQDNVYNIRETSFSDIQKMFKKEYFNVVYAGNIGIMQNVDILIETAKLMKDDPTIWFHIIGDGVYKENLEKQALTYGIDNISFWPMQPPSAAPSIYSAADVNVIPLVRDVYRTALPSKTATCLACQKPIIFAIGKESVFGQKVSKETNCQIIESDNPEELKEAIKRVQIGAVGDNNSEFYLKYCGITRNSKLYAEIITS